MTYLDANVIIRLLEGEPNVVTALRNVVDQDDAFCTSEISLIECRCKPMRDRNDSLLEIYDAFFSSPSVTLISVDREIVDAATSLRAEWNLRTPDAIHAASAIRSSVDRFLTADAGLVRVRSLRVTIV